MTALGCARAHSLYHHQGSLYDLSYDISQSQFVFLTRSSKTIGTMVTAIPPLKENEKVEFGDITTDIDSMVHRSSLIIASYNIRYARGSHLISGGLLRKWRLSKSADRSQLINKHVQKVAHAFTEGKLLPSVDVIALQEADKGTHRAGGRHVARELARHLNMSWVHVPAGIPRGIKPVQRQWWLDFEEPIDLHDDGDTGLALLSRIPISDISRIDLPWHECPWRPRLAMAATIELARTQLRLFNVHVDPHESANGQLEQLEMILAAAEATTMSTVILGDFNTLSQKKCKETRLFLESQGYSTPLPTGTATWRGAGIRLHADWIFTRGLELKRWGIARPLNVSDHWPVWAEISS